MVTRPGRPGPRQSSFRQPFTLLHGVCGVSGVQEALRGVGP